MDNLHWTEVDGVTTIRTDAPEPLRAALLFRTGQADETLITAGHTHLVEHMALAEMADFTQTSNGFVGGTVSGFVNVGRSEDMCIFFRNLCERLASLPVDRLEAEKKILLAEAAGRRYDVNNHLLVWRYGAAGYGLLGQPEDRLPLAVDVVEPLGDVARDLQVAPHREPLCVGLEGREAVVTGRAARGEHQRQ